MTEPKRHPHADVLIAIAEGREVQFRRYSTSDWEDATEEHLFPLDPRNTLQWRVKPQKLKRWMNVYEHGLSCFHTRAEADFHAKHGSALTRIACIEIEFEDGEGL